MTVHRIYRFFISSTYEDLVEERQAALRAVLRARQMPAGMELFAASSEDKWDLITGEIAQSDFMISIIKGKYGSVRESTGLSYTEMEYDHATRIGVPVLAFSAKNPRVSDLDADSKKQEKLDMFRAKLEAKNVPRFESIDQLEGLIVQAIASEIAKTSQPGWVRGDSYSQYEIFSEQVQDEAKRLGVVVVPGREAYAWGTTETRLDFYLDDDPADLSSIEVTWNELYRSLAPDLKDGLTENEIRSSLELLAVEQEAKDPYYEGSGILDGEEIEIRAECVTIASKSATKVLAQLQLLGLVGERVRKNQGLGIEFESLNGTVTEYVLTQAGREELWKQHARVSLALVRV